MNLQRIIDHGVARISAFPQRMFSQGWGDPDLIAELAHMAEQLPEVAPIEITWTSGWRTWRGAHIFEGFFESPLSHMSLPSESCSAYFQMILPREPFLEPRPAVCIHLAGTGDPTYIGRRTLAMPLLEDNIGALILENPYYGHRKPEGQTGTKLRQFTDQLLMNLATVAETRALLDWLGQEGFALRGVSGFSMGGYMSSFVAQNCDEALAAIPAAGGNSPVYPFVESPLSRIIDWKSLAEDSGSIGDARARMANLLSHFQLDRHGAPVAPEVAVILGTSDDLFIPRSEPLALHRHWEGSELRWLEAGHTTGWALHAGAMRDAIRDSFERLERQL